MRVGNALSAFETTVSTLRSWAGLRRAAMIIGCVVLIWAPTAQAGKLDDLRDETGSSSGGGSSSNDDDDDDDDCSLLDALFGGCSQSTVSPSPAYTPSPEFNDALADERRLGHARYFPLYPYRGATSGNLARRHFPLSLTPTACSVDNDGCHATAQSVACVDNTCYADPLGREAPPTTDKVQTYRLQLQLDGGQDRDGAQRGTISGALDGNTGVGLESKFTYWLESLPGGNSDGTWLGDANLRVALVTLPAFQLRLGGGGRFQFDTKSGIAGFNATLGAELYPIQPLVLRVDADVGNLGYALAYESQASLGVIFRRTELLVGVSALRVGRVAFDSAFAGVRFHL